MHKKILNLQQHKQNMHSQPDDFKKVQAEKKTREIKYNQSSSFSKIPVFWRETTFNICPPLFDLTK